LETFEKRTEKMISWIETRNYYY